MVYITRTVAVLVFYIYGPVYILPYRMKGMSAHYSRLKHLEEDGRTYSVKDNSSREAKTNKIKTAIQFGAVAGIFWAAINYVLYFMNFTFISSSVFIQPFIHSSSADKPMTQLMGIGVAALLSILFALAYTFTLSRFYSPWIGIGAGGALFGIFFYILSPLFHLTEKPIHKIGMNTFATELCLFILYGLFLGFSLSSEFSSKKERAR